MREFGVPAGVLARTSGYLAGMWRVFPMMALLACSGAPSSTKPGSVDGADPVALVTPEQIALDAPVAAPDPPPIDPQPMATGSLDLTVGRRLLVPGHGIAQVDGRDVADVQGVPTQVVTLTLESQAIAIPVDSAHEIARELISPDQARVLLAVLRAPGVATERVSVEDRVERQKAVLARDDSAELAVFLRDLYGMKGPLDDRDKVLILLVERDVLGEIGEVTHQDVGTLRSEMRRLYSARP